MESLKKYADGETLMSLQQLIWWVLFGRLSPNSLLFLGKTSWPHS